MVLPKEHEDSKLSPYFITGFSDGEACFYVAVVQSKTHSQGWQVKPSFQITIHVKDKPILEAIKKSLGVGKIYKQRSESSQLRVENFKELETVINHFHKFPLITKKRADFELFKRVYIKMKRKEHLTLEGLRQIVAIRASINWGLSEKLLEAFPSVVRVERPFGELPKTIDPQWFAGFISGEGSFMIDISASKTDSVGFQVYLVFQLTQHQRDKLLMILIKEFLGSGNIYKNRETYVLMVIKLQDIQEKIIPFFLKYPIHGVKALDFADWCRVAELMKDKKHLTAEGLDQIRQIKAGMNTGRKIS